MSKISTVYKKLLTASCLLFFSFFANAQIIETYSITCPGAGDGQLTVTANFCKSTPEYKWSTGDTTATVNGLTAGDYSVRIICQEEVTERFDSITEKTDTVKALVADTVQIADYEQPGSMKDTILLKDTVYYITNEIPVLYDSTYTVEHDTTFNYTLNDAAPIINNFDITENTLWNDANNGAIRIATSGGTGEYSYMLTDSVMNKSENAQRLPFFKNLAPGTYFLKTTDIKGCERHDTILVPDSSFLEVKMNIDSFSCFHAKDATMKVDIDTAVMRTVQFPIDIYFDDELFKTLIGYVRDTKDSTRYFDGETEKPIDGIKTGSNFYVEKITIGQQEVIDHIDTIAIDTLEDYTIIFEYDTVMKMVDLRLANLVALSQDFYQGTHTLRIVTADGKGFRHRWYVDAPSTPGSLNFATTNNACYKGNKGALTFAISGSYDKYLWRVTGPANCFGTNSNTRAGTAAVGTSLTEKGFEMSLSNLPSGKYTVTAYNIDPDDTKSTATATAVTIDSKSKCKYVQSVYISEPDEPIRVNYGTIKDALCESNSGAISISRIDGAQGNTKLLWTLNSPTADTIAVDTTAVSKLSEGLYYIKVTDAQNCTVTDTVRINAKELNENMKIEFGEIHHAICTNNNGFVRIAAVTDAEYPLSYTWSNGEDTKDIYSLFADIYKVTVKDANGCVATDSVEVKNIDAVIPINIYIASKKDVVCTVENGEIIMGKVTGGTQPYTYEWSNGETTESIYALGVGEYKIKVTDADGCVAEDSTTIIRTNTPIRINFGSVRNVKCPYVPDGEITIYDIENSIAPITYKWSNGDSTQIISGLTPGLYKVEVIDGNGCTTQDSITVYAEKQNCIYNIVTPNDDGYNDYLDLTDLCVASEMEAKVFNENGRLVATLTEQSPIWDPREDTNTPPTGSASVYTVFIRLMKDGTDLAKIGESITVIYEK
ncbi:MAG: gliding motility-associated C-terminal domain-containing protein [Paludibacteraceae bacterium]|nr:gliding motility-associated C-terminal domain-containing protein [Paludibacteraceae bacterium]